MTTNDKSSEVIAAILLGCAGVFMVFGMPFFVGGIISELGFTQSQANLVSSAEIAGMSISSLMGIFWIARFGWRRIAYLALLVIVIGNLISSLVSDFQSLVMIRFLTGLFGHGVGFALGVAAIGSTHNPDKNFAYSVASQVVMGSLTALIVPATIAKYGIAGMCVPAIIIALLAVFFINNLANGSKSIENNVVESNSSCILILPLLCLLVMIIWQMGVGPFFNNLVPFGLSINLDGDDIGKALFLSTGLSIIGPLTASAFAAKINRSVAICCALILQIIIVLSFQGNIDWFGFTIRAILFQTSWNFVGPFLMGMVASVDETGKYSVLIPASQLGGISIGHAVIAALIEGNNLVLVNYFCALVILISIVLYTLTSRQINKATANS